jgi:hypothetical protein
LLGWKRQDEAVALTRAGSFECCSALAANSSCSISVASSASAFELLTRFDTGQRYR